MWRFTCWFDVFIQRLLHRLLSLHSGSSLCTLLYSAARGSISLVNFIDIFVSKGSLPWAIGSFARAAIFQAETTAACGYRLRFWMESRRLLIILCQSGAALALIMKTGLNRGSHIFYNLFTGVICVLLVFAVFKFGIQILFRLFLIFKVWKECLLPIIFIHTSRIISVHLLVWTSWQASDLGRKHGVMTEWIYGCHVITYRALWSVHGITTISWLICSMTFTRFLV